MASDREHLIELVAAVKTAPGRLPQRIADAMSAAEQHIKSPPPDTPGLREAAQAFLDDVFEEMPSVAFRRIVRTYNALEDALESSNDGVTLEGGAWEYFTLPTIKKLGVDGKQIVRIEVTPVIKESGGEQ